MMNVILLIVFCIIVAAVIIKGFFFLLERSVPLLFNKQLKHLEEERQESVRKLESMGIEFAKPGK